MRRVTVSILFVLLTVSTAPTCAQDQLSSSNPKRVLLIMYYGLENPTAAPMMQTFRNSLATQSPAAVEFYFETLETYRFPGDEHTRIARDYLRRKYEGVKLDVIAVIPDSALEFVLKYRDELFPGVPIVYDLTSQPDSQHRQPGVTGLWTGPKIAGTLDLALNLQPSTRQVFLIDGKLNNNKVLEDTARKQLKAYEGRVTINYLIDLPMDELLAKVSNLPSDSVIILLRQAIGARGSSMLGREAATQIAKAANVPVYSIYSGLLGVGVIGGNMVSDDQVASELAKLVMLVANGTRPEDISPVELQGVTMVDWRQLRRWDISEQNLPIGSIVEFKQPGFWELYKWRVLGALGVIVLQTLLILGLLAERNRRWRATKKLHDLTTRLIRLQDEEHRRIAAELHDGLGQRLSIIRNRATICMMDMTDQENVHEQLEEISATAVSAIDEVRAIAHNLRPSELDRLGLATAVESMINKISDTTSIQLTAELNDIDGLLSPEAETNVYRIVQEGLNNIVKHSDATEARVEIKAVEGVVIVSVQDNGKGIRARRETGPANGNGFGLTGIAERARMLGGMCEIESARGRGTTLNVRLKAQHSNNGH